MPAEFEINVALESRCVKCGTERAPRGRMIVESERESGGTYVIRAKSACGCGEDRIRVELDIG